MHYYIWTFYTQYIVVQWLSPVQLFATPWTAARQASLSITNSQSLLKLTSIASVMPFNHLILCRPPLLPPSIFPSIRVFSNESVLHIRWPNYWSFSLTFKKKLLLLSRFSHVRLCATLETAAHQAPPSLGFSRQEHWSGLPFPSPMLESESEVAQLCPTLSNPMDCSLPVSSIHGIFQARVLKWGAIAFKIG